MSRRHAIKHAPAVLVAIVADDYAVQAFVGNQLLGGLIDLLQGVALEKLGATVLQGVVDADEFGLFGLLEFRGHGVGHAAGGDERNPRLFHASSFCFV